MTRLLPPKVVLSHLNRSDGSATYSHNGYTVICSVNGPIEAQRRDELPEEAVVDVVVRPAIGVGGVRERHLETILQSTLRQIILVQNHPRMLVQITLQITSTPEEGERVKPAQGASVCYECCLCVSESNGVDGRQILPLLPALIQTSMFALLSASIPLSTTLTSTIIAVDRQGDHLLDPSPAQLARAKSTHVLAFSSRRELHLAESEGDFSLDEWEELYDQAESISCVAGTEEAEDDEAMEVDGDRPAATKTTLEGYLREVMRAKVEGEQKWKNSLPGMKAEATKQGREEESDEDM